MTDANANWTNGRFDWLTTFLLAAGAMAGALGALVLTGWHTGNEALIQVLPDFVPMQYNTALGFVALGAGLSAAAVGLRKTAGWAGTIISLLGALTLLQYVAGINLGIDQLFMRHYITVQTSHPGRMAPNTAVAFLLCGLAAVQWGFRIPRVRRAGMMAFWAAFAFLLGFVALFGYICGVEGGYGWGHLTRMAAHTSAGFIVAGLGALALSRIESGARGPILSAWLPAFVLLVGAFASALLWYALDRHNHELIDRKIEARAAVAYAEISGEMETRILSLKRMAQRWSTRGAVPREEWESDATRHVADQPGYRALVWAGPDMLIHWAVPLEENRRVLGRDLNTSTLQAEALYKARASRTATVSHSVSLAGEERIFFINAPIWRQEEFLGIIIGVVDPDILLARALGVKMSGYAVDVADPAGPIYSTPRNEDPANNVWRKENDIRLADITWRVSVTPRKPALRQLESPLAWVALAAGLFTTLLLATAVRLGQVSLRRSYDVGKINEDLKEEMAKRRRAEAALQRHREHLQDLVEARTAALRQSEGRFRELFDRAPVGYHELDMEGRIVRVNQTELDMLGYTFEEMAGQPVWRFIEDGRDRCDEILKKVKGLTEVKRGFERRYVRKDGSVVPALIEDALLRDEEGRPAGLRSTIQDITERKEAEERLKEAMAELERSNRELQEFAYVASHDLQEPLRMVASYTQLLARRYKGRLDEDADTFIGYAVEGANRMKRLINDLLIYSRVGTRGKPFVRTSSEAALDEAIQNLELRIEESGAQVTRGSLPPAHCDPSQLVQVFQNLLSNGLKFRNEEPPQIHVEGRTSGKNTVFSVRDNGIGIDPEFMERIFIIFQRLHTRDEYPGSGIGLSICKKIIERHGGRIWVESAPGEGSVFYFTLPSEPREPRDMGPGPAIPVASAAAAEEPE